GADGIEAIFYTPWYDAIDTAARELRATGASIPVLHTEKSIGSLASSPAPEDHERAAELLRANCHLATALGARTLVLHLWSQPDTEESVATAVATLPRLLDVTEEHGLDLSVETIWRVTSTPLPAIHASLAADPRTRVTLDTEFLGNHGELEEAIAADALWESGAVAHLQIKDFAGSMTDDARRRTYRPPCQGTPGLGGTAAREAPWVVDARTVDYYRIRQSLTMISSWMDGRAQAVSERGPAQPSSASASGSTGPDPARRSRRAATVMVQREETVSSTSRIGAPPS